MQLSKNIILDKLAVDVKIIDVLPAYLKREALLRPLRNTPDGHIGVVFDNKVYPLYLDCHGDLSILLCGSVFEQKNVTIPTKLPIAIHIPYLEEPAERAIGSEILWSVERNLFGVYIYITAPDEILEQIIIFFSKDMKLKIVSWGENFDPNWCNKYQWSIRFSAGLSVTTIKSNLSKLFTKNIINFDTKTNNYAIKQENQGVNDQKLVALEKEIAKIKSEQVSIVEQKDAELAYLYEELEKNYSELNQCKLELNQIKSEDIGTFDNRQNKRGAAEKTLANALYACFPVLAFTPDAVDELQKRFNGSIAIWGLLHSLNSGSPLRMEKIKGLAGRAGWMELRKHINTGHDDRGRIYCRRSSKEHSYDVVIHWKKSDKDQAQVFNKLANYPPFESNQTVFM